MAYFFSVWYTRVSKFWGWWKSIKIFLSSSVQYFLEVCEWWTMIIEKKIMEKNLLITVLHLGNFRPWKRFFFFSISLDSATWAIYPKIGDLHLAKKFNRKKFFKRRNTSELSVLNKILKKSGSNQFLQYFMYNFFLLFLMLSIRISIGVWGKCGWQLDL